LTSIPSISVALCAAAASLAFSAENEGWKRPYPAHRVAGNVYYVGTEDLACYLITTPKGHILINTGLADSLPLLRTSVESLGFHLNDIKILLNMQAHYDHVAAMAELQRETGAKVYATVPDVAALESGGQADPPGFDNSFAPVHVDRKLTNGNLVSLGGTELKVLLHPGHTKGSVSYLMTVDDNGVKRSLLFANMLTVVMKLEGNAIYPHIQDDFARSFAAQKTLHPDIWVAAHGSQYGMLERRKDGKTYAGGAEFLPAVERLEQQYRERLAQEQHH
jgi:metallo-beta-lactamase class B